MQTTNDRATMYLNILERVNEAVKCNIQFSIRKTVFLYKLQYCDQGFGHEGSLCQNGNEKSHHPCLRKKV